jgi:hypothetical protein
MTQTQIDWSPRKASAEALDSLSIKTVGQQHHRILDALTGHSMTDEMIQDFTGLSPNAERPRRGELVTMGLVVACPEPGKTKSGRRAVQWRIA